MVPARAVGSFAGFIQDHGTPSMRSIVYAIAPAPCSVSNIGWLNRERIVIGYDVHDPGLIPQERSFVPCVKWHVLNGRNSKTNRSSN